MCTVEAKKRPLRRDTISPALISVLVFPVREGPCGILCLTGHGAVRYAQRSANTCFFSRTVRWFTPGPNLAFRQDKESMNPDEAVVLRTYSSEAVASIADSRLRFEGIEAHIQKDDCGGAYPSLQMSRGVRLLVKPEDLQDADKILNEMEAEESGKAERRSESRRWQTNKLKLEAL